MKKYISAALVALLAITMFSCKKEADVNGIEAKLPPVQLSSLGLQNNPPFTTASVLQLSFGATLTKLTPAKFDVEIYDATTTTVNATTLVKTISFNSWSGFDATTPASTAPTAAIGTQGKISFTNPATSYPNTTIYAGTILIKLTGLTAGKQYTVRAIARTNDDTKSSTITVTRLFVVN